MPRECGICDICCIEPSIDDPILQKLKNTICPHLDQSKSEHKCMIYDNRPKPCSNYTCSWIDGYGDEKDQPISNGIIASIHSFNNGTWIAVREVAENSLTTTGKSIILDMVDKIDLPAVVVKYNSKNETGDLVIVKDDLKHRSRSMMGKFVDYLDADETVSIYELKVNNPEQNRTCGECIACCVWPKIEELNKPQNTPCENLKNCNGCSSKFTNNCSIYNNRPKECQDYKCQWLLGFGEDDDRPDKSGLMIDNVLGIKNAFVAKQLWPNAAEDKKELLNQLSKENNIPVIVTDKSGSKIEQIIGKGLAR